MLYTTIRIRKNPELRITSKWLKFVKPLASSLKAGENHAMGLELVQTQDLSYFFSLCTCIDDNDDDNNIDVQKILVNIYVLYA